MTTQTAPAYLPNVIPGGWKIVPLKRAYDVQLGKMLQNEAADAGDQLVPYLKANHVQWGEIAIDNLPRMWASESDLRQFEVRHGDLLVCEGGDVGRAALVAEVPSSCILQNALHRVRSTELGSVRFLLFVLQAIGNSDWFNVLCNRATIAHLTGDKLGALKIPLPSIAMQDAIADFLEEEVGRVDRILRKNETLLGLLDEERFAIIARIATKGISPRALRPSGIDWIGEIASHWEVIRLKRVAKLATGHTPSRQHPEYWVNCTIPWFSLADVWQIRDAKQEYLGDTSEKISELGLANSAACLLPAGTVIVSRTASVGFSGIMPVPMATTQDFANWICGPRILPEYLLYIFRSMRNEFRRLTMGSTHKTIYMPDIWEFMTPLPSIEEQREIVAKIREEVAKIDKLAGAIERQVKVLTEHRAVLITAAVTGQIDVRNYKSKEVAAACQ